MIARTFGAVALLWLASCGAVSGERGTASPSPAGDPPVSRFQRTLDEAGIGLSIPTKGKAILVNVPAFELVAFENAEPVLRSRVIVGTPRTQTPILDTHVSTVRFRPTWRPTPAMVASGEYADRRWPPGRRNPLGLAAIRLEPGLLVYLHDTNRRGLFAREDRALSHGCIRVQRWDELIAWLLDEDLDKVRSWAEGRRTFDMPSPPVPVLIRYLTAFPDETGRIERFDDIYRRERAQIPQRLAAAAESENGRGNCTVL